MRHRASLEVRTLSKTIERHGLNRDIIAVEPVHIPISDILDLHTFQPREIPDLLMDYFSACVEADIFSVRIIHGKGTGILKKRIHGLLKRNPMIKSFTDAPPEAGGWGATLVELKQR